MKSMNRMIRSALAAAAACAAIAGAAAAIEDRSAGSSSDPAVKTEPLGQTSNSSSMSQPKDAQSAIMSWPSITKKAAQAMIEKYGQPDGVTDRMLVWNDKEPWTKVAVYRDTAKQGTITSHDAFLENAIDYKVPVNKVADLLRFDPGLVINVTRGSLASSCDSEGCNFLALNLANEIVTGKRDAASAKDFLMNTLTKSLSGKSSPYMNKLIFSAGGSSSSPDSMNEGTPSEEKTETPPQERQESSPSGTQQPEPSSPIQGN